MISILGSLASSPPITDNAVLDEFEIPFGSWSDEGVDWIKNNLQGVLDVIGWPFEFLINNLVEDGIVQLPWLALIGIMFAIAWLVRNLTVAAGVAVGLAICGLLGDQYWEETARTIGLILVAVLLCVVIGIPLGILAGRRDSVWATLRPTLDAMQVVHSFVYLLPFIYFWGVGAVGATMATMIFALPPLIRLTNLGIRQVPEDVVEAARAYGAPERRVLTDVQLPLARTAIMTGINQTLLLAFSMLGVAAIMGAGGLGRLLFSALGRQDVALASSAGLAFFILAVVMDRMAQTDASGSGLFVRIHAAWKARRQPDVLLEDPSFNPGLAEAAKHEVEEQEESAIDTGVIAPIESREQIAMATAVVGAVVMLISVFLTWGSDSSKITGYSRRADEDLAGQSFSGLSAQGGSWFGFCVVAAALVVIASVIGVRFRVGGRWLAPDGAALAAFGGLIAAFGYLVANPSDLVVAYSDGIGVYVAVLGGIVAAAGAVVWVVVAPYGPKRPLRPHVSIPPIVTGSMAVVFAVIAMFSSWSLDERADAIVTPELQAEIEELEEQAAAGEIDQNDAATQILVLRASAEAADRIVLDGKTSAGAGLGIWTLLFSIAGGAAVLVAAGVAGLGERRRWIGGTLAMGFGAGVALIAIGWIGSLARATDPNFQSGIGSFIAMLAGVGLAGAGGLVIAGFQRSKVYGELPDYPLAAEPSAPAPAADTETEELTETVAR